MKILSSSLQKALNSQTPKYYKKILLYKRLWDSVNLKYYYDNALDITPYLIQISPVKWKLDSEDYSAWTCANTTLTLNNLSDYFTPGNQNSCFSGLENFFGSKVEVYGGAYTSQGKEDILLFRGFILKNPLEYPEDKTLNITLSGELEKLASFSAQNISQNIISELLGQDEGTEFYTSNSGVGIIKEVKQGTTLENASLLKAGIDYKVSSLNNLDEGAKITLNTALSEGENLWCSYLYWWQDKPLAWLAKQVAQTCGNQNTDIEEVYFDNSITNTFEQPSFSSFETGTLENTEISSNTVILKNNFLQAADFSWTVFEKPANVSFTFTGNSAFLSSGTLSSPATSYCQSTQAYGTWQIDASANWSDTENQYNYFISSSNNYSSANGYCLSHLKFGNYMIFVLYRVDNGTLVGLESKSYTLGSHITKVRYRLTRDLSGNFYLWIKALEPSASDWYNLGLITTDNTYSQSSYLILKMVNNGYQGIENISLSSSVATGTGDISPSGTYLSPVIDGGPYFRNWGNFSINKTDNSGSCQVFWRDKDTLEEDWGAWTSISNNQIPSSQKRYLQLKWSAVSNSEQTSSPVLNSWTLIYYTSGVNIALVKTYQMTCLEVMQELAKLSGFIIGYDTQGTFLFKKRTYPDEANFNLTKEEIINIESFNSGIDKLYNKVCVNFGNYQEIKDNSIESQTRPNLIDKYGLKEIKISSGTLLPAENANLALAAASLIYDQVCQIKEHCVLNTKFLPQIDLGDTIFVNYPDYIEKNMTVEGIEIDLENWVLRLDLKEV